MKRYYVFSNVLHTGLLVCCLINIGYFLYISICQSLSEYACGVFEPVKQYYYHATGYFSLPDRTRRFYNQQSQYMLFYCRNKIYDLKKQIRYSCLWRQKIIIIPGKESSLSPEYFEVPKSNSFTFLIYLLNDIAFTENGDDD